MTVNVLGTDYEVIKRKYEDDPYFEKYSCDGYCDGALHQIVLCDMPTHPTCKGESAEYCAACEKGTLRHEIVHAFFNESGLQSCSLKVDAPWPKNEELVDWLAIQGPKLYKAWQSADAL